MYDVLVENQVKGMCSGLLSGLSWMDSTPVAPIPPNPVYSPSGARVCIHNSTVGPFDWSAANGRWECNIVSSDGVQHSLLIPAGIQVLRHIPFA